MSLMCLLKSVKGTEYVPDARRSGWPETATDEAVSTHVLSAIIRSPTDTTWGLDVQIGISQSSDLYILYDNRSHLFKLQHHTEYMSGFVSGQFSWTRVFLLFIILPIFHLRQFLNYWWSEKNNRNWIEWSSNCMLDCKTQGVVRNLEWRDCQTFFH